jgi:ABC-type dipeptide/oligopeptide/nickel transport system permease subunit
MPSFFLISAASLVIVVLAFNLVGDALRDALDPRADK